MHEENLITEHRLPEHTHMHRHRVSSGTPALSDLSFSSFQERQLTEVGWRKKRVRGWGMNGVVVVGGLKSLQSNGIGLPSRPALTLWTNTVFLCQEV